MGTLLDTAKNNRDATVDLYIMEIPTHNGYTAGFSNIRGIQEVLNKLPGAKAEVSHWHRNTVDWFLKERFSLVSSASPLPSFERA